MPEQLCNPDTEAPEGQAHTGVWPPEPADEPEPYNRPRDLRAYARQALIDTYRRGRGPGICAPLANCWRCMEITPVSWAGSRTQGLR